MSDERKILRALHDLGMTDLMKHAKYGDVTRVCQEVQKGADVNAKSEDHGFTALMYAAANGYPDVVNMLLYLDADPHIKSNDGRTALDVAREVDDHESILHIEDAIQFYADLKEKVWKK